MMKHLDLFSGIGGFALAARWAGFETIGFCEIEEFPRNILRKNFPGVPIFKDIRELHAKDLPESPDIITGGYPCQGESLAGKRRGKEDDRWLWPEMFRLIRECRPTWVIGENVAGHKTMGLDQVLTDLESANYTAWTFDIPAVAIDSPHKRHRLWVVAHANGLRMEGPRTKQQTTRTCREGEAVADAKKLGRDEKQTPDTLKTGRKSSRSVGRCGSKRGNKTWLPEPGVGRVVNGVSSRVDRIKGLGNAIVPQVAYQILKSLE